MGLLKKRPLAAAAAALILAMTALLTLSSSVKIITAAAVTVTAVFVLFLSYRKGRIGYSLVPYRTTVIFCTAAFLVGAGIVYFETEVKLKNAEAMAEMTEKIEAEVNETVYETSYGGAYLVKIRDNSEMHGVKVLLESDFPADIGPGDVISAEATYSSLRSDADFDERSYYLPRGVFVRAEIFDSDNIDVVGEYSSLRVKLSILRMRISGALDVMADSSGGDGGLAAALFIGDRSGLDDSVIRDFKYTGTYHLLAVSGMHLSVLIGLLDLITTRLSVHKTPRVILLILCTAVYMGLTGFQFSVTRAGSMLIIYYLSHFSRREPDRVTSLFVSVAVIMISSPCAAGDTGLLLSFLSMLGCVFASEMLANHENRIENKKERKSSVLRHASSVCKYVISSFAVSAAALMFTLPVMWLKIGSISLLSPMASLILTLPMTLILYLCPIALVTYRIRAVSDVISALLCLLCRLETGLASALSHIRGVVLPLSSMPVLMSVSCAVIIISMILSLITSERRRLRIYISSASLAFAAVVIAELVFVNSHVTTGISYLNLKNNDAVTVTDGDTAVIIDASDGSRGIASCAADDVRSQGADRIDAYVLTHLHSRSAGTVAKLCRSEYVEKVLIPEPENESEYAIYVSIKNAAEAAGVKTDTYVRGRQFKLDGVCIDPSPLDGISRSTHPVIAFSVSAGEKRAVYVGSSVHESGIYTLALEMCRDADTVFFGVHGPKMKSGAPYQVRDDADIIFADTITAEYYLNENGYAVYSIYNSLL